MVETFCSSFSFSFLRFRCAVWASSCRALVRVESMGLTRNSLAP